MVWEVVRHGGVYAEGGAAEQEAEHPQKSTGGKLVKPLTNKVMPILTTVNGPWRAVRFVGYTL